MTKSPGQRPPHPSRRAPRCRRYVFETPNACQRSGPSVRQFVSSSGRQAVRPSGRQRRSHSHFRVKNSTIFFNIERSPPSHHRLSDLRPGIMAHRAPDAQEASPRTSRPASSSARLRMDRSCTLSSCHRCPPASSSTGPRTRSRCGLARPWAVAGWVPEYGYGASTKIGGRDLVRWAMTNTGLPRGSLSRQGSHPPSAT